jgi:hypothetical protein
MCNDNKNYMEAVCVSEKEMLDLIRILLRRMRKSEYGRFTNCCILL